MKKKLDFYLFFLFAYFFSTNIAHAYLDPGTGTIILQSIIAIIASVGAAIALYWQKCKQFMARLFSKNKK